MFLRIHLQKHGFYGTSVLWLYSPKAENKMYYDFLVKLPDVPGKPVCEKRGNAAYVKYEYDRTYDSEKKITRTKRVTIGELSEEDSSMIRPNQNFFAYFPNTLTPLSDFISKRSSCLRAGA